MARRGKLSCDDKGCWYVTFIHTSRKTKASTEVSYKIDRDVGQALIDAKCVIQLTKNGISDTIFPQLVIRPTDKAAYSGVKFLYSLMKGKESDNPIFMHFKDGDNRNLTKRNLIFTNHSRVNVNPRMTDFRCVNTERTTSIYYKGIFLKKVKKSNISYELKVLRRLMKIFKEDK